MKLYQKKWTTLLHASLTEVWQFFSNPSNLQTITPDDMNFKVLTNLSGVDMYTGLIIKYEVSPLAKIPMNWVTEITAMQPGKYFIDEQRFGPFAFWQHQHHFSETSKGIMMTDLLHYAMPLGIFGRIANGIVVSKRIDHIFEYRQQVIDQQFP